MQKSLWIKEVKNLFYKATSYKFKYNLVYYYYSTVDYYFKMRNTQFIKL